MCSLSAKAQNLGYLNAIEIIATAPAGINGDYNNNGKVDAADYVVWRKYVNTTHTLPNDPTGGTIGTAQYNTWRSNFGTGGPGAGSVLGQCRFLNPASLLLAALSAAGLLFLRRR